MKHWDLSRGKECLQTCSDVVVYPLNRHCGVCDGVSLLVLYNSPDAAMHLDGGNDTVFRTRDETNCRFSYDKTGRHCNLHGVLFVLWQFCSFGGLGSTLNLVHTG